RAYVCGLFIEGKPRSSESLAQLLGNLPLQGYSQIVFLIGGSNGMSQAVRTACHETLSFSPMTFPHQLMRVMLCEQLYRAQTILAGTGYHK
ncbi:MAG: 23S rRNA (pseudouridine(1915)-N(3))-methyltransferase RlmH, partial [Clostridia bacterium]|nr:23S rRNA (pseudouridine(1915)-N(3))-methyltransferase RlmH [Clostridia bacterium]